MKCAELQEISEKHMFHYADQSQSLAAATELPRFEGKIMDLSAGGAKVVAGWVSGLLSEWVQVDEGILKIGRRAGGWRAGTVFRGGLCECMGAFARYFPRWANLVAQRGGMGSTHGD